jgi:hypothetical protein
MSEYSDRDNNMTQEEWRNRIETILRQFMTKIDTLEHKLDQVLYEDEINEGSRGSGYREFKERVDDDFVSEEDIISKGQKVPYNKIVDDREIEEFREFITYVRTHEHEFASKEYDYAGFADKNFSDVRLSDNSRRILGTAYAKVYKRPWKFNFIRGNMFKLRGSIAWRWNDGSED